MLKLQLPSSLSFCHQSGAHIEEDRLVFSFPVPKPWPVGFECPVTLLRDLIQGAQVALLSFFFWRLLIGPQEDVCGDFLSEVFSL